MICNSKLDNSIYSDIKKTMECSQAFTGPYENVKTKINDLVLINGSLNLPSDVSESFKNGALYKQKGNNEYIKLDENITIDSSLLKKLKKEELEYLYKMSGKLVFKAFLESKLKEIENKKVALSDVVNLLYNLDGDNAFISKTLKEGNMSVAKAKALVVKMNNLDKQRLPSRAALLNFLKCLLMTNESLSKNINAHELLDDSYKKHGDGILKLIIIFNEADKLKRDKNFNKGFSRILQPTSPEYPKIFKECDIALPLFVTESGDVYFLFKKKYHTLIGEGSYKKVKFAIRLNDIENTSNVLAVIATSRNGPELKKEHELITDLGKNGVDTVKSLGMCAYKKPQKPEKYYMLLNYCNSQSLLSHLERFPLNDRDAFIGRIGMAHKLAREISLMHASKIVHLDLKPENILTNNGCLHIGDFGLSQKMDGSKVLQPGNPPGTLLYTAPEVFSGKFRIDTETTYPALDVWALGMMIFDMFSKDPEKTGFLKSIGVDLSCSKQFIDGLTNLTQAQIDKAIDSLVFNLSKEIPNDNFDDIAVLLKNALKLNPEQRCTAGECHSKLWTIFNNFSEATNDSDQASEDDDLSEELIEP